MMNVISRLFLQIKNILKKIFFISCLISFENLIKYIRSIYGSDTYMFFLLTKNSYIRNQFLNHFKCEWLEQRNFFLVAKTLKHAEFILKFPQESNSRCIVSRNSQSSTTVLWRFNTDKNI